MNRRQAEAVAEVLSEHGFTGTDEICHADMDAAADVAGVDRPETRDDRFAVAEAYGRRVGD